MKKIIIFLIMIFAIISFGDDEDWVDAIYIDGTYKIKPGDKFECEFPLTQDPSVGEPYNGVMTYKWTMYKCTFNGRKLPLPLDEGKNAYGIVINTYIHANERNWQKPMDDKTVRVRLRPGSVINFGTIEYNGTGGYGPIYLYIDVLTPYGFDLVRYERMNHKDFLQEFTHRTNKLPLQKSDGKFSEYYNESNAIEDIENILTNSGIPVRDENE